MKAILYTHEESGRTEIDDFGVRVEDRAYYEPVLNAALDYNNQSIEKALIVDDRENVEFLNGRISAISEFLDNYDPSVQDKDRYFDITYEEAMYAEKVYADDRKIRCDLMSATAAKYIITNQLDVRAGTYDTYKKYKQEKCIFVARTVGQVALKDAA